MKIEIGISDILSYIGNRSRPLKEGEAAFKAGHIILCGFDAQNENIVRSLCLQTSALFQPPHEISINFKEDSWNCVCSCKAGMSGFCKHAIATLIYINRNEDLELLSCTDLKQKWGKEKAGIATVYEPTPFVNFCHPDKSKKYNFNCTEEISRKNFDLLSLGIGNSAIAAFMGRTIDADTPNDVKIDDSFETVLPNKLNTGLDEISQNQRCIIDKHFHSIKIVLNNVTASQFLVQLKERLDIGVALQQCCNLLLEGLNTADILDIAALYPQGSDMWKKERQLRITGSSCYSIYTFGRDSCNWEEKALKFFFPKEFTSKYTEHGKTYEKEALETFRKENPNCTIIMTSLIISSFFPWLGFSPDGIIFNGDLPKKLLEIKCPYAGKEIGPEQFLESLAYLESKNSIIQLKKKHKYYAQVQLGMALLNLPETVFIMYSAFSKTYLELVIPFDQTFAEDLITTVSFKYFKYLLHFYCLNKSN